MQRFLPGSYNTLGTVPPFLLLYKMVWTDWWPHDRVPQPAGLNPYRVYCEQGKVGSPVVLACMQCPFNPIMAFIPQSAVPCMPPIRHKRKG